MSNRMNKILWILAGVTAGAVIAGYVEGKAGV